MMMMPGRDKLNPHHHHPRDKLTERKRYLSKSREAIFEKVRSILSRLSSITQSFITITILRSPIQT